MARCRASRPLAEYRREYWYRTCQHAGGGTLTTRRMHNDQRGAECGMTDEETITRIARAGLNAMVDEALRCGEEDALCTELMASAALHVLCAFVTSASRFDGDATERALNNLIESMPGYVAYHLGE